MGSRIGFCVEDKDGRSQILRKRWVSSIEEGVKKMWQTLGGNPDDSEQAIRDDLGKDRAFAACVVSFYNAPFDSIEENTNCDISDNGLIVIDIKNYKAWKISHIKIGWKDGEEGKEGKKRAIAQMGKGGFVWLVDKKKRENLGEGLE